MPPTPLQIKQDGSLAKQFLQILGLYTATGVTMSSMLLVTLMTQVRTTHSDNRCTKETQSQNHTATVRQQQHNLIKVDISIKVHTVNQSLLHKQHIVWTMQRTMHSLTEDN